MTGRSSKYLLKNLLQCFFFASLALLLQPSTANAQPGIFSATGLMTTPRGGPTATLLANGQVLLTGGCVDSICTYVALASAELYNPATGVFSATGSMNATRFDGQTATPLSNGQVLIAGGYSTNYAAPAPNAEVYDPTTGIFTPAGPMVALRYQHTATLLPNGKVLIAGGCLDTGGSCVTLASAELYDPATGTFSPTGPMIAARADLTATLLPNGKVLVAGGVDFNTYTSLASAELYDPATGTFSATGSLITGRDAHSAALLPNGKVLVVSGYNYLSGTILVSAELYDPTAGTFSATGPMTNGRIYQSATLTGDGKFLILGGVNNSGLLSSAESYDPATGSFSPTGSMSTGRDFPGVALLPDGQVLVAGGSGSSGPLGSAELYSSQTITFTTNAPASAIYNSSFTVAATGGASGNPVIFTSSGACSNVAATYTMTSATGTCSVIANQAGNTVYPVAPTVTQTVTANPASQTITVSQSAPAQAPYNSSFTIAATGGASGNAVIFTSSGACSNLGATYTMTSSTGTCTVTANQSGNGNYMAAPTVTETTTAAKAAQMVIFTGAPATASYQSTFAVAATTNTGITPTITATGSCSISGTTVSMKSGTGLCTMTAKWAGNTNYLATTVTQTTTAEKLVSTVTWTAPAAIPYGTALSGTQLDAIASTAGSFVYSPAAGTVPKAGSDTLKVTFTPTLSKDYATATASVALEVNQVASIVTWTEPAAVVYGTALSGSQLDAQASVAGKFVYSPAAGKVLTAGTQTLSVTFTPTDHVDYSSATDTVTLVVNKVDTTTTITSNVPNPSTHGKPVLVHFTVTAATNYKAPTGKVTVNASTGESCSGTLVSGSGNCSVTFSAAGSTTLTATYAGDNNNSSSVSVGVTQTVN